MASDNLRLLFELDVDHRSGTAGLLRFRKEVTATIDAVRRAVTQPLKSLNTAPLVAATAKASVATQELANRQARAAQAAQRLQIGQQRLAVSSNQVVAAQQRAATALQRAANGQTQAAAGAIRVATAYQRATAAANSFAQSLNRNLTRALSSVQSGLRNLGSSLQSIGRTLTVGITAPVLALGAASLKSAKDLDANVNTLKAFTGSAEAAEKRLAELIKTARGTPGLTTNLALTLDAQLRVAKTTQETIDRVLPAIGRLNAVSKLPDPGRFVDNLKQLITQNFERQDLKELVGQSPLAGQLLTEIFNVDSPTNAKAIREQAKKLGLTSVDAFFNAFAEAAAKNQGLATVTESIGTRFDKIVDRVTVALRPLGLAIINAIEPFIEPISRLIERVGEAFNSLSAPVKTAIIVIAGIAAAAGPVLFVLGGLTTAIAGVVSAIGTIAAAVALVGLPAIAAAIGGILIIIGEWVVILTALGLAWKTNFLNIRGLVSDAASAVLQAFNRIKVVLDEAAQRILPTLQSITTKVLAVITLAWEKYGKTVLFVVGEAFRLVVDFTVRLVRVLTDFVDLVLKLIDGDWRGAWQAFSRIVINAIEGLPALFNRLQQILARAMIALVRVVNTVAVRLAVAATQLANRFIATLAAEIISRAPQIRDAIVDMFLLAAKGFDATSIAAVIMGRLLGAMRRAAKEGLPTVGVDVGFEGGIADTGLLAQIRRLLSTLKTEEDKEEGKGADTAARRRIRILEIEADKIRTLTDAQLAREQIAFDERKRSLEEFTNLQIKAAGDVLLAQLAIYKQEREEALKIKNKSARDLALAEIGQKEFEAQQAFTTKVAQLEAAKRKAELDAAREHRRALLDIQEQADDAEIARLEDLQRQGFVTAFDIANRQTEIESEARARRRAELEIQKKEAGDNLEERKKIIDELEKHDAESAESVRRNQRLTRDAAQETADAFRDYALAIREAGEAAADAARNAASIALTRLIPRALLTDRQRVERQFVLDRRALEAEKRASDLRIDNAEREAVEKSKKAGKFGEEALKIEKTFNGLRLEEQKRFEQERAKLQEDRKAALERTDPNSPRSLFGDTFADFGEAIRIAADGAGVAISSLQVILGSFGAAAAEHFAAASASAGNFISILLDGIDSITAGLGDMLADWVLLGETGAAAFRKLIASTLAYYARTFLIKALDNIGEGFSNLAKASAAAASGNLVSAALYKSAAAQNFISAAKYGIASAATAVAGRFAAGDSFKQKETARRAVNGGEDAEPRNRSFNYGGQAPVESSSRAVQDGSGGPLSRREANDLALVQALNNHTAATLQLNSTISRFETRPEGVVFANGAEQRPDAVGVAFMRNSQGNHELNEYLQGIASGRR